ncbi:MAG: glycosyltransferase [Bacillota bacterium]
MKVLMLIDSIGIGGAETHLINLVKKLKENKVTPYVVSNGGIYENNLIKQNIKHYKLPVMSKNPIYFLKNIYKIKNLVKQNNIDIIHAHGRLPSFLGKCVSKGLNVEFMTTAHAKVENESFYKYITTYGDNVIAVSEDIKNYIIDKFNVQKEIIEVIPNGIDTDEFKDNSNKELINSLNLRNNTIKILSLSRMDDKLAQIAIDLIDILKDDKRFELIIVGDGNRFSEIKNKSKTFENIKVLGKRTDISKLMGISDIVVAVSRSALEALSCEKMVILAGGEGYLGFFNEGLLNKAIEDNFTGRNSSLNYSKENLKKDIDYYLEIKNTKKEKKLKEFNRKVVKKHYSLEKMVKKTIKNYNHFLIERSN